LRGGKAFEPIFDPQSGKLTAGRELTKKEVFARRYEPTLAQQDEILAKIFEDSPFKIHNPEASYVDCNGEGRRLYTRLALLKDSKKIEGTPLREPMKGGTFLNDKGVRILETIPLSGRRYEYYRALTGLVYERLVTKSGDISTNQIVVDFDLRVGSINFGASGGDNIEVPISDANIYVEGVRKRIEYVRRSLAEYEAKGEVRGALFMGEWLKKLGYHLYGFAQQARKMGDIETELDAEQLAVEIMPLTQYAEVISRRIDEQGRFRITREDLK